jgi:hypothetical protein
VSQLAVLTIDHELGGALKDLFVIPPKSAAAPDLRRQLERTCVVIKVEPAHVIDRIVKALQANVRFGVGVTATALEGLPLVLAAGRVADRDTLIEAVIDLAGRGEAERDDDLDDEAIDALDATAEAMLDALDPDGERGALFAAAADCLLHYLADYEGVPPTALTIDRLRTFLLEFAPAKFDTGGEDAAFIDCVRDVVLALGTLGVLSTNAASGLIADLERHRDEAIEAFGDPDTFGIAKLVFQEMRSAGVDLDDPSAISGFLEVRYGPPLPSMPETPSAAPARAAPRKRKR